MPYTKEVIDKLGNAMVYMARKVPGLSKTKLLKLIYLLEEVSVKRNKRVVVFICYPTYY
jgi:hypothetical protein